MDIWQGLQDIPQDFQESVVTIGVFDGVHRGHQKLIDAATTLGHELGAPSVLLTFNPHPLAILRPDRMPPMLGTVKERADLAAALGVDHMLALSFNVDMARLSPEEFFVQILVQTLHAKAVVVGENFSFGHKAAGTTQTLRELGEKYQVKIQIVELLAEDGTVLCSTLIRQCLANGEIAEANHILGRRYSLKGEVARGAGRGGRELGFPTANLYFPLSTALPADGVYAGWVKVVSSAPIDGDMVQGVRYPAAISVGLNPTFDDARRSVESFVLDRDADLYGHTIIVEFVSRIRGMEKFTSVEQLLEAIADDVEQTRTILRRDLDSMDTSAEYIRP